MLAFRFQQSLFSTLLGGYVFKTYLRARDRRKQKYSGRERSEEALSSGEEVVPYAKTQFREALAGA